MIKHKECPRCKKKMWVSSRRCRRCFSKSKNSGVGKLIREQNRYALKYGKVIVEEE